MDFKEQRASCEKARQLDMVAFLSGLGYEPVKIRNQDYWYLSPLRNEKTPSFKINQRLNRWYDHGMGKGGNLIDFAVLYYRCTVGEFLAILRSNVSFHPPLELQQFTGGFFRQLLFFVGSSFQIGMVSDNPVWNVSFFCYTSPRYTQKQPAGLLS